MAGKDVTPGARRKRKLLRVPPEEFRELIGWNPTPELCAYFGVTRRTLQKWMSGASPVPFAAYRLAKWRSEGQFEDVLGREWRDIWHNGRYLFIPGWRAGFSPDELRQLFYQLQDRNFYKSEVAQLKGLVGNLTAENTRIRELYLSGGVTDELREMHERLAALLARLGTAKVFPFPPHPRREAKA